MASSSPPEEEGVDLRRFGASSDGKPAFVPLAERPTDGAEKGKTSTTTIVVRVCIVLVLLGVITFVVIDGFTDRRVESALTTFLEWVEDAGIWGPIVYSLVYVIATIAFVPGTILTLGAGFVFSQIYGQGVGVAIGSVVVFVGATVGAACAFLLGRYAFRECVSKRALKYKVLAAIDKACQDQGFKVVTLLRLSPVIPFNAFNYFVSITGVPFWEYAAGSVGMIPGTVAFVYFGSLLSDVKNVINGDDSGNPAIKASILGVGIVATIVAIVVISVFARRAVKEALAKAEAEEAAAGGEADAAAAGPTGADGAVSDWG